MLATAQRLVSGEQRTMAADRPLDVRCHLVRTGACDPLLSFAPRLRMSAADVSGRSLTPDSVRQRYKAEFPVSGRSHRPEDKHCRTSSKLVQTAALQRFGRLLGGRDFSYGRRVIG